MTEDQLRTARELIDKIDRGLVKDLAPMRNFLERLVRENEPTVAGYYEVAVGYTDDDGLRRPVGIWKGFTCSLQDARSSALDEYEDERIDGWWTEVLEYDAVEPAGEGTVEGG